MFVTDPIADMLTRIRNALIAKHTSVAIPFSREKLAIAKILESEGYVAKVAKNGDDYKATIDVDFKPSNKGIKVITGLQRISKPGLRIYCKSDDLPKVLGGLGIAIISTSKGIMTDKNARTLGIGGEVLAYVW